MTRIRFEDLPSTNTPRNAENLNKLNNVVISKTTPITGEEVWIQKGKNLLSGIIENYTLDGNGGTTAYNGAYITNFIKVLPNTSYVASGTNNQYKEWYDENLSKISNTTDNPATSPSNARYLRMNGNLPVGEFQIEQGSTATSYEPYIEKKIHTKNNNGYYEEFYREIESGSNDNGNYIKFADGTMICHIQKNVTFTFSSSTKWGILWESNSVDLGTFPATFINEPLVDITVGRTGSGFIEQVTSTTTTNIGSVTICRPVDTNGDKAYRLNITAIGKWK